MAPNAFHEIYERLADREHDVNQRDIYLVLAADAAQASGAVLEAERLRERLLGYNPHHLLNAYGSFADALSSNDIHNYVADLRQRFPPEIAAKLTEATNPANGTPLAPLAAPSLPLVTAPRPSGLHTTAGLNRETRPKNSPYERYEAPPLPPPRDDDVWGRTLTFLLWLLVLGVSVAAGTYVLARPFMNVR